VVDVRWRDPAARPLGTGTLWLLGREAVDAGVADEALEHVRALARPVPHAQAVLAAVEAAATGAADRWHDALAIALDQGLRLIAVDAFEGLAVTAAAVENWTECLRLLGSAHRLRNETGYEWRFGCEQLSVNAARTAAVDALGDAADTADTEGRGLDWRAAAFVGRAFSDGDRPALGEAAVRTPADAD
jgi:hypothetical protein